MRCIVTDDKQTSQASRKDRLLSLDALRGFDMLWITGAQGLFAPLAALTGWQIWRSAEGQMEHVPWNGFAFYDLIFPLFVFLSGVTLGLSPKYLPSLSWRDRRGSYARALRRLALLIFLGILYNYDWDRGVPTDLSRLRYASVLGRIGIAWFAAAMIVWHVKSWRAVAAIAAGILLVYWAVVAAFGDLTPQGCVHAWIDQRLLPGVCHANKPYDPEGLLLSHVSATVNALLGYLAGRWLMQDRFNGWLRSGVLLVAGAVLLALGWLWNLAFPVNKELWTSSFVLVTCGWGAMLLAVFYAVVDVARLRRLAWPLAVIGANAILIYFVGSIVDWGHVASRILGGLTDIVPKPWLALLAVFAVLFIQWLPLAWLYRRRIHIRV
jgi:predicted acyltransferase